MEWRWNEPRLGLKGPPRPKSQTSLSPPKKRTNSLPLAITTWVSIYIIKPLSTALRSTVNKNQQHQENFFVNAKNQTQGCWVRTKYATSVLCSPHSKLYVETGRSLISFMCDINAFSKDEIISKSIITEVIKVVLDKINRHRT